VKVFNSVSDLQAASLTAGQLTQTKRYYAGQDGGGATYLIKTAVDYAGTPDEYGDHTLANGNVAVLQAEGSVNVKLFGATGDGVTDDTAAIQAAIDYAIDNSYQTILLNGKFNITNGTLLIDKGTVHTEGGNDFARKRLTFVGGSEAEILKTDAGFMFSATSGRNGDIAFDKVTFSGTIDNTGISSIVTGLIAFDGDKLIRLSTTNCTFRYLDYCWYQDGTVSSPIQSLKSINNTFTKNNVIFRFNQAWDIVFDGGLMEDGNKFITHKDVNSTIRNLVVSNGATIEGMQQTAIELNCVNYGSKIINCYFEANQNHIQMNRFNAAVAINNNSFFGRGSIAAGDTIKCIDVAVGSQGITVDGNLSTETNTNTILISIDQTSAYNSGAFNIVGKNVTLGSTITDTPLRVVDINGMKMLAGSGNPEGSIVSSPGFIYLNRDGGASTTLYVKESGTGNTGWVAK